MKKILILMLSVIALTACSKDDNNNDNGEEKILGTWFLVDARAGTVQNTLTECNQNSFITFNSDGTGHSEYYEENNGNCEVANSDDGTWENKGNSQYSFSIAGYGTYTGTVNFESSTRFTFTSPDLAPIVLVFEK